MQFGATTATLYSPPATGSLRCSALQWPTRTIRSARSMRPYECSRSCVVTRRSCASRAPRPRIAHWGEHGEVVTRSIRTGGAHAEYTPIGLTTNLASRMEALAPTGSIAVTETTQRLCEGYFTFRALGPARVKGVSEPVNVHEVTGIGTLKTRLQRAAGRGLTKFVGREQEMAEMRRVLELAKQGRGQIVAAIGEAGLGKSRLFYEFKATAQSGCLVLETFSVSHGKASAYLPIIDFLNNYFEIEAEDDARKRREKVGVKVLILDRRLEDTLPYMFA